MQTVFAASTDVFNGQLNSAFLAVKRLTQLTCAGSSDHTLPRRVDLATDTHTRTQTDTHVELTRPTIRHCLLRTSVIKMQNPDTSINTFILFICPSLPSYTTKLDACKRRQIREMFSSYAAVCDLVLFACKHP